MIKANELRIGNCVKLNNSDTTLVPRDFQRYCKSFGIFEEFEPIELTEEWLLKAGFERLFPTGSTYSLRDFNVSDFGENGIYHYDVKQPIKYVHQLQNLYFAMTGEELVFSTEP